MNSLLYYYNNVQKMAAYRQAKRMQLGALTAQGGFSTTDPAIRQVPCTIQCVFIPQTFELRQCVIDTCGYNVSPRIDILDTGNIQAYFGGTSKTFAGEIGRQYNVTFVVSETEQSVYVGGEFLGNVSYASESLRYYVIGGLTLNYTYRFQGDIPIVRHFNYAMSADEVKSLDNNGDPMGYVVPKLYRQFGPEVTPKLETYEFNIGDEYYRSVISGVKYPFDCIYRVDYVVNEWDYQPKSYGSVGFLGISGATILTPDSQDWGTLEKAKVGEPRNILVKMPGAGNPALYVYGGNDNEVATARHLKVTIKGITPVGLLAEYLPQNLMESRKGVNIIPTSYDFVVTNDSPYLQMVIPQSNVPFECIYRIDYVVNRWNYVGQSGTIGFSAIGSVEFIAGVRVWLSIDQAKIGETQSVYVKFSKGLCGVNLAEGQPVSDTRELEMTIVGITPVSVPISWLDSAKQLPLSDESLPPLFQSMGGYDMAANGAPEILYNE